MPTTTQTPTIASDAFRESLAEIIPNPKVRERVVIDFRNTVNLGADPNRTADALFVKESGKIRRNGDKKLALARAKAAELTGSSFPPASPVAARAVRPNRRSSTTTTQPQVQVDSPRVQAQTVEQPQPDVSVIVKNEPTTTTSTEPSESQKLESGFGRLWGGIGFVLSLIALPYIFNQFENGNFWSLAWLVGILFCALWVGFVTWCAVWLGQSYGLRQYNRRQEERSNTTTHTVTTH